MQKQQICVKRQPRKILGINSQLLTNGSGGDLSNNAPLQQTQQLQVITDTTNENMNPPTMLTPQQQQQLERLRLANIMNQEMHALWPHYGTTFLSPMLPPYALATTMPYAAVPIYQTSSGTLQNPNVSQQQVCSNTSNGGTSSSCAASSATTSSGTSSSAQSPPNDSNKINIQIGLQCVNQNMPQNFNSINEMNASLGKVNLLNFCGASSDKEKECSSSLRSSPMLLSPEDLTSALEGGGGDASNFTNSPAGAGTVTLSQAKFNELTMLALRGSEIAEKLAQTHRNRPCFKKIDSLCARMKQDLIRPDGVLPNINSQGIAWAVKDFIFVFTRVINAWIIIKGYVYNTPEGLNKVKAALSPGFAASFVAWQDTTMDFVENLMRSFVNLDNLVQSQKNVYQKPDSGNSNANGGTRSSSNSTPIKLKPSNSLSEDSFDFLNSSSEKSQQSSLNKNYLYTMVEDSEGRQRQANVNGTYFKTGTYTPIMKDTLMTEQQSNNANDIPVPLATPQLQLLASTNSSLEQHNDLGSPTDLDVSTMKIQEKIPPNWLNYDVRVLVQNLSEFSNDYDPNAPPRPLGKDLIDKLNVMIERLMAMKNAEFFFKMQFTKNYFPTFISKHHHDFIDIRSIILKCQVGGYQHIFEVVHDVRKIIHSAKEFLKLNLNTKLQKSIGAFESEFNKFLTKPPFENYQFDHITGAPKEMLYNNRNK